MAFASLLLTMSVYMLVPVLPQWMMDEQNMSPQEAGLAMGCFGVGLYVLGVLCSWLVQRYRRNVVCLWAVVAVAVCHAVLIYLDSQQTLFVEWGVVALLRTVQGAAFGLAQMVLSSTLIIDTCESFQRTEANHSASWFSRFSLSLGPLLALVFMTAYGFHAVMWGAVAAAVGTLLLIRAVSFPFRSPEERPHVLSADRFFLTAGLPLFLNLLIVGVVVGMVLSMPLGVTFYGLTMGGFLLALLAQRFVFRNAELESEVVTGLLLLVAALLVLLVDSHSPAAPLLFGLAVGLTASRFLLFFVKVSRHCQRGTSQSTFFLAWESGISFGLCAGYAIFWQQSAVLLYAALALTVLALAAYHFFTFRWFLCHKNR